MFSSTEKELSSSRLSIFLWPLLRSARLNDSFFWYTDSTLVEFGWCDYQSFTHFFLLFSNHLPSFPIYCLLFKLDDIRESWLIIRRRKSSSSYFLDYWFYRGCWSLLWTKILLSRKKIVRPWGRRQGSWYESIFFKHLNLSLDLFNFWCRGF